MMSISGTSCCTALKKALGRVLGDRVDFISVVDLLEEIETLARGEAEQPCQHAGPD
jgi:hypothetical protein